jgi:hypothetical protein
LNYLDIVCPDSLTVSGQPNDDAKELPIGFWDYRITSKDGVSN